MNRVNLLGNYPNPKNKRYVSENLRTINHRIVASYRGKEFYDGKRIFGKKYTQTYAEFLEGDLKYAS